MFQKLIREVYTFLYNLYFHDKFYGYIDKTVVHKLTAAKLECLTFFYQQLSMPFLISATSEEIFLLLRCYSWWNSLSADKKQNSWFSTIGPIHITVYSGIYVFNTVYHVKMIALRDQVIKKIPESYSYQGVLFIMH